MVNDKTMDIGEKRPQSFRDCGKNNNAVVVKLNYLYIKLNQLKTKSEEM